LFERFNFLLKLYKKEHKKYLKNKGKVKKKSSQMPMGEVLSFSSLDFKYHKIANWIAISCIEAFFSWTEHLFIHLVVIGQNLHDGQVISNLIESEWKIKFKKAIPENTKEAEKYYNELLIIRQQLRNFVAHGAFGKNGNAFKFYSNTGAVPVQMNHNKPYNRFSLHGNLTFNEEDVIILIESFIDFLWKKSSKTSMFYTQKCRLPAILTYAADGTYQEATKSMNSMKKLTEKLFRQFDDAANMDW
jgi:hypothetical protein